MSKISRRDVNIAVGLGARHGGPPAGGGNRLPPLRACHQFRTARSPHHCVGRNTGTFGDGWITGAPFF